MNEITKTTIFVVVAVVIVGLVAWESRPTLVTEAPGIKPGDQLFPDFTNPLVAASLEIVKYDEDTATVRPFEVAQVGGLWSIPSHENYPADAKDQVADVAANMMGLTVLRTASESPGDHQLYGVIDPDPKTLKGGATGVGTRVTMKDKNKKTLMSLIIGKQVEDRPELHYVRRTGQAPVYSVAMKTDKLSTKFEDWIEEDLLKLNTWDIKRIRVRDYSVDELNGTLAQRADMTLEYDDTGDPKWKMVADKVFKQDAQGAKWIDVKLGEDEELNATKLDDMKNSLDDLKIVDVARKPAGLSANLKAADSFGKDAEAVTSLHQRGFYMARLGEQIELFSNEGEIRCLMKDGVNYILRFGEIAGASSSSDEEQDKTKEEDQKKEKDQDEEEDKDQDSDTSGLNRYIFVMAEFDPTAIAKPELEPLPEEKKQADPDQATPEKPKNEKTEKPQPEAEKTKNNKPAEEKSDDGKTTDAKPETTDDAKKDDAEAKQETTDDEKKDDVETERERIKKENKRKQEEYDEKIEKGKKHVKELNDRFADWYYIISDEVYRKIHLDRKTIVKKKEKEDKEGDKEKGETGDAKQPDNKEPEEEGNAPADFNKLKEKGPRK